MNALLNQKYELVSVDQLKQHPRNPRRGNTDAIGSSIAANGFYGVVVAQKRTGYVLAGNHRLAAAQQAGIAKLPVVWVDVDDDRALRILLTDNRTTDLAVNDERALYALLEDLALSPEVLAGTGFDFDALEDMRASFGDIPTGPQVETGAHYAETPEQEAERLASKGTEPSIHSAGLRELVLVYPSDEHAALVALVGQLRPALGQPDATTSQVVAAALRVAAQHPAELAACTSP